MHPKMIPSIIKRTTFIVLASGALLASTPAHANQHIPNLAKSAKLTSTSKAKTDHQSTTSAILDGNTDSAWIGGSPNEWYGFIYYPSLTLKWEREIEINTITIRDRPDLENHTAAATIKFDDGHQEQIFAIPNDGRPHTITFPTRQTKSLVINIVDGTGTEMGLSELFISHDPEAVIDKAGNKSYPDLVSYVDPTIETGRGRWFFCTPGSRPYGLVSAAPYTRNKNQGGGGYNYNSTEIGRAHV